MLRIPYGLCVVLVAHGVCWSQTLEPVLTKAAVPNAAGVVTMKFDFVSPLGGSGVTTQALPEPRMEVGLGHGLEAIVQFPLLRVSRADGSSVFAGGEASFALQYLLAGSATGKYAVSFLGRVEVPTGDSAVVGNETQLMPMVLVEWHPVRRMVLQSNVAWNTTVAGTSGRFANFQYADAVEWFASKYFIPVFEFAGSTSTIDGRTQLLLQPEIIVARLGRCELKTGIALEPLPTLHYAIRSQLAWSWGRQR